LGMLSSQLIFVFFRGVGIPPTRKCVIFDVFGIWFDVICR
jgi:hypothetical protein